MTSNTSISYITSVQPRNKKDNTNEFMKQVGRFYMLHVYLPLSEAIVSLFTSTYKSIFTFVPILAIM